MYKLCVIGDPVAHSRSPAIHTALLAAARGRGLPVIGGLALLHAQAELAFELFVG